MSIFEMRSPQNKSASSTQSYLKVREIRDDCIIMKDSTLRAVIGVSSTNFDLKNEDEQNALIYNFQRFLNSLEHPTQILMQSRRLNVGDYTEKLRHIMERQTNELLRVQTAEYIEFISRLVENANVMNKSFYVIVPLSLAINPGSTGVSSAFAKFTNPGAQKAKEDKEDFSSFSKNKNALDQRVTSVASGLSSIGLRAIRLNTNQLIELLYNSYNFEAGPIIDASKLSNIKIIENEE